MNDNKFNGDDYEFSSRKNKTKSKKNKAFNKKRFIKAAAITAGIIAVLFGGLFAWGYSMIDTDVIADGVYAGNISLGGLSLEQAEQALEAFPTDESYEINLLCGGNSYIISTEGLDYTLNSEKTAEKAFSYGKSGNVFSKVMSAFSSKHKRTDILPAFEFDSTQISEKLNEIGEAALGEMTEHSAQVENNQIVITPGTTGYDNDPSDAVSAFELALENQLENEIEITFNSSSPEEMTVDMLHDLVSADGLDAAFEIKNGEVVVIEGRSGYTFDDAEAAEALKKLYPGGSPVTISCTPTAPKISSSELKAKLFNSELASYSTRYNAGQTNRSKNVAVAAGKLNGVIVLPGETLSFNNTVGKRSTENGFMPAPEYQNGRSVTGIGGGTCQVSTTLYSAALYANLEIVSRRNHSMSVSYVPLGQDATVTDSGTDLKIKNNTKYPIKLVTSAGGGTVTVKIIGTAPEPPVTVKIINTATGELSATTTRVLYDSTGAEISREVIATSKYKPHNSGNSAEASTSATTLTPTATPMPNNTPAPTQPAQTHKPAATEAPAHTATPESTPKPASSATPSATKQPAATAEPQTPTETTPSSIHQKTDSDEEA